MHHTIRKMTQLFTQLTYFEEFIQLLHELLHIHKIYIMLHIKTLNTLGNISVVRPSTGIYIFLAKVALEIVTYQFRYTSWVLWQHGCNAN